MMNTIRDHRMALELERSRAFSVSLISALPFGLLQAGLLPKLLKMACRGQPSLAAGFLSLERSLPMNEREVAIVLMNDMLPLFPDEKDKNEERVAVSA
jgi:hypothetical protein